MMASTIADLRKDYRLRSLLETDVDPDPVKQFDIWWQEAVKSEIGEVNAMTLATASADGVPAARIVLLKGYDERGFIFFTNYHSYKGNQLEENPRACLVFFWKELERQVRITGLVQRVSDEENDLYFNSRPEDSRISACISPQSKVIDSREWLEQQRRNFDGTTLKRPSHWGGYRVKPVTIEFWQGRPGRLHDRLQYSLLEDGSWQLERLAP